MKNLFILALMCLLWVSCENVTGAKTTTIDAKFTIDIPTELQKTDKLLQGAQLQYANNLSEFYVIGMYESRREFDSIISKTELPPNIDGYTEILKRRLSTTVVNASISEIKKAKIDGLNARLFSVTGMANNVGIYYQIGYIEGKKSYYQLVTWTLKDKQDEMKEKMTTMIASFKEVKSRG